MGGLNGPPSLESYGMFKSGDAFDVFMRSVSGEVLNIGSGIHEHTDIMKAQGLSVTTLDNIYTADIKATWPAYIDRMFDAVWCSHVLEHSLNPGLFLSEIKKILNVGGVLAITVPPAKHNIVGGHVSIWNAGLLLYHLILAGFDCSNASVKSYGYNISVIVENVTANLPDLISDNGDIEALSIFFPLDVTQGFDGEISIIKGQFGF